MQNKVRYPVCISLLLLIAFYSPSKSEPYEVTASQLALIVPDSSNTDSGVGPRILMKFDLPDVFDTTRVRYAWIQFKMALPVERQDSTLAFRIYPLTTDWTQESVGWRVPWDSEGGDYIDSLGQLYFFTSGSESMNMIDVTDICRLYSSAELANSGFIIVPEHVDRTAYRILSQLSQTFRSTLRLVVE